MEVLDFILGLKGKVPDEEALVVSVIGVGSGAIDHIMIKVLDDFVAEEIPSGDDAKLDPRTL